MHNVNLGIAGVANGSALLLGGTSCWILQSKFMILATLKAYQFNSESFEAPVGPFGVLWRLRGNVLARSIGRCL